MAKKDNHSNASWLDILSAVREELPDSTEPTPEETVLNAEPARHRERLDIIFEKKGRGGKTATIISGFTSLSDDELLKLASAMKQKLGTGGSARGNEILIQGDRRQDVLNYLKSNGFNARII